jgi:hypothetical protein
MEFFKFGNKKDVNEDENKQEINQKNNEEFSKKVEALKDRFYSINFPSDFEVKLTNDHSKQSLLHFLIKKEGAPNSVDGIVWAGFSGEDTPEWEVMTSGLDNDSLQRVKLDDTENLIKAIKETFDFDPNNYRDDERDDLGSDDFYNSSDDIDDLNDLDVDDDQNLYDIDDLGNFEENEEMLNDWDRKYLIEGGRGVVLKMYEDFNKNFPNVILLPETTSRPLYYLLRPIFEKLKKEKGTIVPKFVFFNIRAVKRLSFQRSEEEYVGHEIETSDELKKLIYKNQTKDMTEERMDQILEDSQVEKVAISRKIVKERAEEIKNYLKENPNATLAILDEYIGSQETINDTRKAFGDNEIPAYGILGPEESNYSDDFPPAEVGYGFHSGEERWYEEDPNPALNRYAFSFTHTRPIGVKKEYDKKYSSVIKPNPDEIEELAREKKQLRNEMKNVGVNIAENISEFLDNTYEEVKNQAKDFAKSILDEINQEEIPENDFSFYTKFFNIQDGLRKHLFTLKDIGISEQDFERIKKYEVFLNTGK